MYFGLVHYPRILHKGFQTFRQRFDPFSDLLPEHITFIHPVPECVGQEKIEKHIEKILGNWKPFDVHFCTLEKTWDHWLYMGAKEGGKKVVQFHDELYEGILRPYLREDLPFYPHIGLGFFGLENYDFNNPTAELSLDENKFKKALQEFKDLGFDYWCTIDKLTLVKINSDFTECVDLRNFKINS